MRVLPRIVASLSFVGAGVAARAEEAWSVDNLKTIGGHPVTVVGHPSVLDHDEGKALRFDGAHDGVFVSAIPIAGSVAFTIEVLFRPIEGGATEQRFFHVQDPAGKRSLLEIRTDHRGHWWLDAFLRTNLAATDKGLALIDPAKVHATNQWYWAAMRYDGKHFACFVNGVKQVEGEGSFGALDDGKVSIGVRQNLLYWFKGDVREVRWHRAALSDAALQRR